MKFSVLQYEEDNQVVFRDCSAKNCALGFHVERRSASSSDPCAAEAPAPEGCNLSATLVQCQVDACHLGLMVDEWRARVDCLSAAFTDVARPVLVARAAPFRVTVGSSEFSRSPEFLGAVGGGGVSDGEDDEDDSSSVMSDRTGGGAASHVR